MQYKIFCVYQRRTWDEFKRVLSVAHASQPVERAESLEYSNQLSGVCWGPVYSSFESIFLITLYFKDTIKVLLYLTVVILSFISIIQTLRDSKREVWIILFPTMHSIGIFMRNIHCNVKRDQQEFMPLRDTYHTKRRLLNLCSSGMLHHVRRYFATDFSERRFSPNSIPRSAKTQHASLL